MTELIRDTVLGHLLRLVSKGKILPYEEEQDPLLWRRYIDTEKSGRMAHHGHIGEEEKTKEQDVDNGGPRRNYEDVSRGSSTTGAASHDAPRNEVSGVKIDPEKGKDVTVVTWFSEDDPEVSSLTQSLAMTDGFAEPHQLVAWKEILRHVRDLSSYLLCLYWIRDLLSGYPRRCSSIWSKPGDSHTRSHTVRSRLWNWAHDLGPDVRDSTIWSQPGLHWHTRCLRIPTVRCNIRKEFRHASSFSISDGFLWKPRLSHRRC